jgi:hypothetical protein
MKHLLLFIFFFIYASPIPCQDTTHSQNLENRIQSREGIEQLSELFERIGSALSESQDSQIQLNVDAQALDSILKSLPLSDIQWNGETYRLDDMAALINRAFPDHTRQILNCVAKDYPKTLIVGFLGLILLPVIFIVLLSTILGIPIALLILPLLVVGGFLLGISGFGLWTGQYLKKKLNLKTNSSWALIGLGILALELPSILRELTSLFSPILSIVFLLAVILVFCAAWVPGLGAVVLTRFGTRTS